MGIKWKEDYSARTQRFWGVMLGVVAGVLIGIPIGWGATKLPSDTSFILALVTAIGTIGSAVGAVGIAGWQFKTRREELYIDAIQIAASAQLSLAVIASEVEACWENIRTGLLNPKADGSMPVGTLVANSSFGSPAFPDARRLAPISPHLAAQLASAEAELSVLSKTLDRMRSSYLGGEWNNYDEREKDLLVLNGHVIRIVWMINNVAKKCREAVSVFDKSRPLG